MNRATFLRLAVYTVAAAFGLTGSTAFGQSRLGRTSPGLILETGAPRAFTDALVFTADGNTVLAAGEDKVVRSWDLADDGFATRTSQVLRWPIYREQRGSIFALAPLDPQATRVAVAGYGNPTNLIAVLNRRTGQVEKAFTDPRTAEVIWKIAISPNGKYLVYGTENGRLLRWGLDADDKAATPFVGAGGRLENRMRLIAFLDNRHFVTVSRLDRTVRVWDVEAPAQPAVVAGRFSQVVNLFRVVLSPDKRWLAATGDRSTEDDPPPNRVEVLRLQPAGASWTTRPGGSVSFASPRDDKRASTFARVLAFSPDSRRLAVGCRVAPETVTVSGTFNPPIRSITHVYALTDDGLKRQTQKGLHTDYMVEQIAFRPGRPNQLATAGGANHELRLFDLSTEQLLDEIKGPGSCIWQVAMSKDGKYLGWREGMNLRPKTPNDRAAGPWRAFTLTDETRKILNRPPAGFTPLPALNQCDGWRLETTESDWLWRIRGWHLADGTPIEVGPSGGAIVPGNAIQVETNKSLKEAGYFAVENQVPQCYTFIKGTKTTPTRLAIGHQWGVSLYELRPGNVRLARMLTGHEGKVMSVAPSPDGKLLFSTGLDQTIACWSLEKWPSQSELGMTLAATDDGRLRVRQVDPGSPAWEAGLTDNDVIDLVGVYDRDRPTGRLFDPGSRLKQADDSPVAAGTIPYRGGLTPIRMQAPKRCSPEEMIDLLRLAEPQREYVLVWHNGKTFQSAKTTLRQRPLWRFFPTRADQGSDWVLWRWRDFYYDTNSANADRYLGWHVNAEDPHQAPRFHALANFSGRGARQDGGARPVGFHNPAKVWRTVLDTFQAPEKVIFPDIEPPVLTVTVQTRPGKDADGNLQHLQVRLQGKPRDDLAGQQIVRASLWVNDTLHDTPITIKPDGSVDESVTVRRSDLAQGGNLLTFTCFNRQGGRAESRLDVPYQDDSRPTRTLYAVCVGNNEYGQVKGYQGWMDRDLRFSATDAAAVGQVLKEHAKSRLFDRSEVVVIPPKEASADRIRTEIRQLGEKAHPNDLFVLFLSGHGMARRSQQRAEDYEPGTFYYICHDTDAAKPESTVSARDLHDLLAKIKGRKLLLIDACHSGAVGSNPHSDISEGAPFLILSACRPNQEAIEPTELALVRGVDKHGLFTQGLLTVLGGDANGKPAARQRTVTARQLGVGVRSRIAALLQLLEKTEDVQVPEFTPADLPRIDLLCRP
ncbi:MAG: caspase family protein [Gemmataceae bacterium]